MKKHEAAAPEPEPMEQTVRIACTVYGATMGSVDRAYEDVLESTGVAVGATATATFGYRFMDWFDEAGEKVGSDPVFVSVKGEDRKFVEAMCGARLERVREERLGLRERRHLLLRVRPPATGWCWIDGAWYWFGADRRMATDWVFTGGAWP